MSSLVPHEGVTRANARTLSGATLAAAWPTLEPSIIRALRRLGASPALAEDIAQDVAVRALQSQVRFESAAELLPWAHVVARRRLIDVRRKESRSLPVREIIDVTTEESVEGAVVGREELRGVGDALHRMKDADRQVLLATLRSSGTGGTKRERDADALRLMRARRRLRAALGAITGVLGWLWGRRPRLQPVSQRLAFGAAMFSTLLTVTVVPGPSAMRDAALPGGNALLPAAQPVPSPDMRPVVHRVGNVSSPPTTAPPVPERTPPRRLPRVDAPIRPGPAATVRVAGHRAEAGTRENSDVKPLVCMRRLLPLDVCVDQPVR